MAVTEEASVSRLLRFLEPELSRCLGRKPAAAIRRRAESLPLGAFRLLGFEVPLAAPDAPADLLLQLAPAVAVRPFRASLRDGRELDALLASLTDAEHPLFGLIGDAWLEYDVGSGDGRRPSLFASPSERAEAGATVRLLGATPPAEAVLVRFLDRFGGDDRVQQLGVMHGRGTPELRCVVGSDGEGAAPGVEALGRSGWLGDGDALARALAVYGPLAHRRSVGVGVTPEGALAEAVGVELHLPGRGHAERLLTRLEADGLAPPGACERLLAWHGHAVDAAGEGSPPAFRALSELSGGKVVPAVVRRVHHVKLTLMPGRLPVAKAYIGARMLLAA